MTVGNTAVLWDDECMSSRHAAVPTQLDLHVGSLTHTSKPCAPCALQGRQDAISENAYLAELPYFKRVRPVARHPELGLAYATTQRTAPCM